jgi:hypothetical protein
MNLFFVGLTGLLHSHAGVTHGQVGNPMATHLTRRGSVYYLRRRIPQDLIPQYGRQEIVRSLHTTGGVQAERLLRRASVELDDEFVQRRGEATLPSVEPSHIR